MLVPCNDKKRAVVKAYTTERVSEHRVLNHNEYMGIIPKYSQFMVFDIDEGTATDIAEFVSMFPNSFQYATPRGGIHLWVKYTGINLGNKDFTYKSVSGDIRHNNGYVMMWGKDTTVSYTHLTLPTKA